MEKTRPGHPSSPRLSAWIVVVMVAMVALPAALALATVRSPVMLQMTSSNPTPYGYTCSLLLFIVPIMAIAFGFLPRKEVKFPRKAFWWTIGILVPLGFATDFFFASRFFIFSNTGATLGIAAPALHKPVPIEEYVFYLTGFIAVLLLYLWLDEYWLAAYKAANYRMASEKIKRLFRFHALFFILLISLLWEATLAVPYQWWDYQPKQMIGVRIGAWASLPIEAVCVWIAVTYATAIVFEIVKLWLASEKPARQAFLGLKNSQRLRD